MGGLGATGEVSCFLQLLTVLWAILQQPALALPESEGPWSVVEVLRCFRVSVVFGDF